MASPEAPGTASPPEATMSLFDHLGELRSRILRSGAGIVLAFLLCWWQADRIFAWCEEPYRRVVAEPLSVLAVAEAFLIKIRVAFLASLFLSAPLTLYQAWAFIRPGLHPHERRLAIPFTLSTSAFFLAGGAFGYFVGMPAILEFLIQQSAQNFEKDIRAESYIFAFSRVLLGMGAVFEAPVLSYFLARLGVLGKRTLIRKTKLAIILIAILAALITPSGDIPTMVVFAAPMLVLYGLSILIVFVTARE